MRHLDLTLPSPAENLACEEALLDWCEENGGDEVLRLWESPGTFVVVGYANKAATEANIAACQARGIPVLRRCSGGGTVLQGAGCLNYALILRITEDGPLRSITSANQFIMERNRAAIETLFSRLQTRPQFTVRGHTDLTMGGLKFSGNSQRRKKNFLLFHGTFLLNFDLALVGEFLHMPSLEPGYRASRSHEDFLVNLNVPSEKVKAAICQAWNATEELKVYPRTETRRLAAEKYSTAGWNFKF
jgi:lipoate-protein ligase A